MQGNSKKLTAFLATISLVIIIDQISKYLVRTTPSLQNFQIIKGWLEFSYTQNPGIAFGIRWLPTPIVSLIALVVIVVIFVYTIKIMKKATTGQMIFMGMIVGGALGNIVDRMFLGFIQSNGGFLDGRVVDFIHFSLVIDGHPVFPYIFNFADSCITVSVLSLLIFNKYLIPSDNPVEETETLVPDSKDDLMSSESVDNSGKISLAPDTENP